MKQHINNRKKCSQPDWNTFITVSMELQAEASSQKTAWQEEHTSAKVHDGSGPSNPTSSRKLQGTELTVLGWSYILRANQKQNPS